jgi:nucleotide-binding universal stress UspA family protein
MLKRILIALAGTPYTETAIRMAVELAQRHNASLTGVTVVDINRLRNVGPVPVGGGEEARQLREKRLELTRERVEEALERFDTACRAAQVEHQVLHEERQEPYDYMVSQARYHDLVVMGLRGLFDYGVTDHDPDPSLNLIHLIQGGVRPILAVTPKYRPPKRVWIAYSGSMASATAMRQFVQFHWDSKLEIGLAMFGDDPQRGKRLLHHAAKYCRAHGLSPETMYFAEPPKKRLLAEAAAWQADLIVMGNCGKSVLMSRLLGDTMLNTARNTEIPLFLSQ